MCGRSGVAGDAAPTSQQGCGSSTSRQWQEGLENGQRALRRRAERRIGSLKVRQRLRSIGPKLSIIKSRMKEPREGKAFHLGEKVACEEEWENDFEDEIESRKKLDEQRKKLQKDLRDVEKLSCVERGSGQPQK